MALRKTASDRGRELPTLRELAERRGLSIAELAQRSGYTAEHMRRVARGDHPGSRKFHALMESLLGGKYRVGGQLSFSEAFLPHGVLGRNTLKDLMKAQGITGPQPLPRSRPPSIDNAAAEALIRAIEGRKR